MFSFLLRPLRQLAQALVANDSPRQIAWAIVLGMWLGLLPKGNLLVVLIGMVLFGLRLNKPAGLMSAGVFSLLGLAFDGLAHRIGSFVLLWDQAKPVHVWLYDSLWGPWFGLNNTVVVGQLLIAAYLTYPTFVLSLWFVRRVQAPMSRWLLRYRLVRWIRGAEWGTHWGAER